MFYLTPSLPHEKVYSKVSNPYAEYRCHACTQPHDKSALSPSLFSTQRKIPPSLGAGTDHPRHTATSRDKDCRPRQKQNIVARC